MGNTWLVVGLGNPGARYAATRHNVGQFVVDELAARHGAAFKAHKANARVAETWLRPGGPKLILAKPNSFMNVSGGPVAGLVAYYGIGADRVIVVHDELDLDEGTIRLKRGGGEGGHNGLRSISNSLGTKDYHRVRVGIGRPPGRMDAADYVLRDFSPTQRKQLPFLLDDAADAVESLVTLGLLDAQQKVHAPR